MAICALEFINPGIRRESRKLKPLASGQDRRGRRDSMSAKSLAKYPQGSILRDIIHPPGAAGAGTSAPL